MLHTLLVAHWLRNEGHFLITVHCNDKNIGRRRIYIAYSIWNTFIFKINNVSELHGTFEILTYTYVIPVIYS